MWRSWWSPGLIKGAVGIDGKTCATATNIRAASSTGSVIGDGIKRGPVTDDEIKNLMSFAGMLWGPKGKTSLRYKIMMHEFAKSRGLID